MTRRWCAVSMLMLGLGSGAAAQQLADGSGERGPRFLLAAASGPPVSVDIGRTAVLRRRLSLDLRDLPLKAALAAIAEQSGLVLAYSDDVLPAGGRVSLRAEGITVAAALTDVLADADVDVVFSRSGHAALVPRTRSGVPDGGVVRGRASEATTGRAVVGARVSLGGTRFSAVTTDSGTFRIADVPAGGYTLTVRRIGYVQVTRAVTVVANQEVTVDVRLEVSASPLDAVVVTGTIAPTEQKALANPITVITGDEIQRRGITRVDELFRGDLPGIFAADYGDGSAATGAPVYVRGTTSLWDLPALKTYVDGVELANSQFLNEIDPAMIDRIEIVRGPEASTLYGAEAIGGVMQIFTKRGRVATPPHVVASVGAGRLDSPTGRALRLQNNLTVDGGTADVSYYVGTTYQHDGAWTPGHSLDVYSAYGSLTVRPAGSRLWVDVSARIGQQVSRSIGVPSFAAGMLSGSFHFDPFYATPQPNTYSLPQQTLGVTVHHTPRPYWQQELTLGIDRGANGNDMVQPPAYTAPTDSFTKVFSTQSLRATAAYHSAFDTHLSEAVSLNAIVGADYWDYQSNTFDTYSSTTEIGSLGSSGFIYLARQRDHDAGVFGQVRLGVRDALFLTAGARVDQGPAFPADRHHRTTTPRVGASYVIDLGSVRAKLRGGYGSALKPASPDRKAFIQFSPGSEQLPAPNLLPERQNGWDAGAEVYVGERATLSVTRYRQLARDLLYAAFLSFSPILKSQFQNVARVRNAGWELEGSLHLGAGLAAKANYSETRSVVEALAPNDQTGFAVGDDLPGVPHHSGALTLSKTAARWNAETEISYVGASRNYNQRASFAAAYPRLGTPVYLGNYVTLPAAYRAALRVGFDVSPHLSVLTRVENLTNQVVVDQGWSPFDQMGRTTFVTLRLH